MGDATLKLMAAMQEVFIRGRDVDILPNSLSQIMENKPTIPGLKRRIRYCRNPMEKKKLQQELNEAYNVQNIRSK